MPPARQDEAPEYPFAGPFPGLQSEVAPSQIGNAGFAEVQNLLFRNAKAQIMPDFTPVCVAPPDSSSEVMGFYDFFDVKGFRHSGVFTEFGMYEYINFGWVQITSGTDPSGTLPLPGVPSFNPTGVTPFFQTAVVGYKLYFSNSRDSVQVYDGLSKNYYTAYQAPISIPGFTPTPIYPVPARYLMELDFHLLAANTLESPTSPPPPPGLSAYFQPAPNRVHWSGSGNGSDWSSFNAGQTDLFNNLGPITGMTRLFQSGYIFQQWGVTQVVPTGQGLAPFQFVTMGAYAKGNVFPYSLAAFGELIACYVGRDDIYVFDGTSSQPIGQHPIDGNRRLGARSRITQDLFQVYATWDQRAGANRAKVWGVIMTAANGYTHESYWLFIPELNKAWIYNFDESNWAQLLFQPFRLVGPANSAFWAPQKDVAFNPAHPNGFTPVDSLVISSGSSRNAEYLNFDKPGAYLTTGLINPTDGWYVRSGPLDFDDNRHPHTVNKVRIILTDVAANMRFFIRLTNDAGVSTPTYQIMLGEGDDNPITIMVYLNNGITGAYITWELSGPPALAFELVEVTPYPILGGEIMTRCEVVVGGGGGAGGTGIAVMISPGSASVAPGAQVQFNATVTGTTNNGVTWTVDVGTIDATGLWTAPSANASVVANITATSVADPTAVATAQASVQPVAMPITVHVTPISGTVTENQTLQFSATVTNTNNVAVNWQVNVGTIDQTGLFTAPPVAQGQPITATIMATSVADPTAAAQVTVTCVPVTGAQIDLLQWCVLPSRATQHLGGDPTQGFEASWLDTDAGYPANYPKGCLWWVKNKLGNPWDVVRYDANYAVSHWMTENGDAAYQAQCQAANGTSCWLYNRAYKRNLTNGGIHIMPRMFIPGDSITIDNPVPNDVVRTADCETTSDTIHLGFVRGVTTGPFKISWGGSIDSGSGTLANGPNYDNVNGVDTIKNQYMYTGNPATGFADVEETYYVLGFGRVAWYYYHNSQFMQKTVNTTVIAGGHPVPNFPCGPGQPWFIDTGASPPPNQTYPNLEQQTGWTVTAGTPVGGTDPNPGHSLTQGVTQAGNTNTMVLSVSSAAGLWGNVRASFPPPALANQLPAPPSGVLKLDGLIYLNHGSDAIAMISIDNAVAPVANSVYNMSWKIDYTNNGLLSVKDGNGVFQTTGIQVGILTPNVWHSFETMVSFNFPGNVGAYLMLTIDGTQYQIPGNVAQMAPKATPWTVGVDVAFGLGTNAAGIPISAYYSAVGYTYPAP